MKSLKSQLEGIKDLPDSPQKEKLKALRAKTQEWRTKLQEGAVDPDKANQEIGILGGEIQMLQLNSTMMTGSEQKKLNTPNWHSGEPTAGKVPYGGIFKKEWDIKWDLEKEHIADKIIEDGDPIKKAKREAAKLKRIQNKNEKSYNELAAKIAEGTVKVYTLSPEEIQAKFNKK